MVATHAKPDWYADPAARHHLRYWDGEKWTAYVSDHGETALDVQESPSVARRAHDDEHYVMRCRDCGFTHHIPKDCALPDVDFSVDPEAVRMTCLYGGVFTVSLSLAEFFDVEPTPASGNVLMASIGDNMRPLHEHLLTHCDPVFLVISQTPRSTSHVYRRQPEGNTYVRFSNSTGVDIVGPIDVSKAEIPGVS